MGDYVMDFNQKRKEQKGIKSLGDMFRSGHVKAKVDPKKFVHGPSYLDCLVRPWTKGDLCGVLGGAGTGKSTFCLNIFKHILENNSHNSDIVVFVSLEMSAQEIAEKWFKLVGDNVISDRFYIVENFTDDGKAKSLGVSGIKYELMQLRDTLGVNIISWACDHLHIVNINGAMDYNNTVDEFKQLCVELDTFGIILSQTTKGKGIGDIPIPKDGCYNCSKFEWNCSYIISIFQPLMKVQSKCNLPVLAFQYAKIRYKNKMDKAKEQMNYLLYYDFEKEFLRELEKQEKSEFAMLYEMVLEIRANEEKFKSYQFDISETIQTKDGKEVKVNRILGGEKPAYMDEEL